jgi:2'-5' RNA ligase
MGQAVRVFIALPLAAPVQKALNKLIGEFRKSVDGVRWVEPDGMHLTLKFLGETDLLTVAQIARQVERISARTQPIALNLQGIGAFPRPASPRVVWVGVTGDLGPLEALQTEIEDAMRDLGFPREIRRWTPHITLGRVRESGTQPGLKEMLEANIDREIGVMTATEAVTYSSALSSKGARYDRLATARLGTERDEEDA